MEKIINYGNQWLAILLVFTLLFSCKQRDDYPEFGEKVVPVVEKDTIPPDNAIESITKKIMDNSTVIKTFQLDSSTTLAEGVIRTHVRFLNSLNQPISMQILQVDLSQAKIGTLALSPFDDYLSTSQSMSDMAKYGEAKSGGEVVAAVNGDASTGGVTTGSFIKSGRQIKTSTTTSTVNTRPFFAVKYDGTAIIGNRPNATFVLDPYVLSDFKHLVSGTTWLVYKDALISSTVTTVQAHAAIGLDNSKKLYCIVVDGGTPVFSVGLSYNDLGKIMKALGSYSSFVLNSGTSAVMVQRTLTTDRLNPIFWQVVNKPTTPTGAASANGIGFVRLK